MAFNPLNPNAQATMANSQPVVLASDQTPIADISAVGTLAAAAQTVALSLNGQSAGTASITGTWVGTITFEGTIDGTNYFSINAVSASTSAPQTTTIANGLYRITPGGLTQIRVNMSSFTSGTASIKLNASVGVGGTFVNQILPSKITDGTSTVTIKAASTAAVATDPAFVVAISPNNTVPVSGTFFQTTQPVSLATNTPTLQSGSTTAVTQATAANLNATVVGNGTFAVQAVATQLDTNITGTISATDILAGIPAGGGVLISTAPTVSSFVSALVPGGTAQADIQITGTATGTYYFEASMDSTTGSDGNWIATNYRQTGITNTILGFSTLTGGVYRGAPSGFKYIRVRNVGGTTPSNPIIFRYSNGGGTTFLNASIPAGTNSIGTIATITNPVPTKEQPDATATFSPTNSTSTAYETSRIVKASAGTLYSITGYNSKTSTQFIQIHNSTTVPADTAVPVIIFTVPASSNFSFYSDKFGRFFSTGITICNSSTGPTKTIGAADIWLDVQFQ